MEWKGGVNFSDLLRIVEIDPERVIVLRHRVQGSIVMGEVSP